VAEAIGSREKMKPKGLRKGGREAVESNEKRWGIGRTDIACQPLLPGETPIRTPGAGQDILRRCWDSINVCAVEKML